jgi:hypothetical protein
MAITKNLGMSTGTFAPMITGILEDRSGVEHKDGHSLYKIDLKFRNINETEHIKWCRRNLGERSSTWDFWLAGGILYVEVWGDKAKFTYEMWKN